jgi:hypothetical protein
VVISLLLTENSGWSNHVTAIQKISPAKIIAITANTINGAIKRRTPSRNGPPSSYDCAELLSYHRKHPHHGDEKRHRDTGVIVFVYSPPALRSSSI